MNFFFSGFWPTLLDLGREDSLFSLVVPLLGPLHGADVSEDAFEVVARLVVVALHLRATVEVHIVLPAVPEKNLFKINVIVDQTPTNNLNWK